MLPWIAVGWLGVAPWLLIQLGSVDGQLRVDRVSFGRVLKAPNDFRVQVRQSLNFGHLGHIAKQTLHQIIPKQTAFLPRCVCVLARRNPSLRATVSAPQHGRGSHPQCASLGLGGDCCPNTEAERGLVRSIRVRGVRLSTMCWPSFTGACVFFFMCDVDVYTLPGKRINVSMLRYAHGS